MQKKFKQSNTWGFPFWGQAIDAPTCCRPNDLQEPQHPNDLAWDLVLRLSETWRLLGMPIRDCTTQGVCDVNGLTCWYSNMWETSQNYIQSYFCSFVWELEARFQRTTPEAGEQIMPVLT